MENHLGNPPTHPTEIRTSISPSSAVKQLSTTNALANYATEAAVELNTTIALATYVTDSGAVLSLREPGPSDPEVCVECSLVLCRQIKTLCHPCVNQALLIQECMYWSNADKYRRCAIPV
uniref:Uncharacterized protein n=1 Tax=Timema shepardi TaxID=629360 RepID=A0A7R9FXE2_TIMSH|nr:unnamed protein product [Timema shepardi]